MHGLSGCGGPHFHRIQNEALNNSRSESGSERVFVERRTSHRRPVFLTNMSCSQLAFILPF